MSPRVSPTAVVIVAPLHQLHLVMVLEEAGWSLTTPGRTGRFLPPVFVRLEHPALVSPIDIDDIFPGFSAAPAEVFEQLCKRRVDLPRAGVAVPALDRVSTILGAGHGQLGALARDRRAESHVDYFVTMFRTSLTPSEQEAVVELVDLVVDSVRKPIIFAKALFESPHGHRGGPFRSITRMHPMRVIRALLAAPRSIAIIAGPTARQRSQFEARPSHC
jgi:hypothetical protein